MRRIGLILTTTVLLFEAWPFTHAQAQNNLPTPNVKQHVREVRPSSYKARQLRASGTSFWSEDFENGLNGWTVNTATGTVDWQLTATGNTGGFTPGPLESTTGFPGGKWIVADSDAEGTAGFNENTSITSPAITGYDTVPYMLLSFEQSFRQLNDDQTLVEVSGDGGLGWTTYEVNTDVPGNQSTPGAPASQLVSLNISDALNGGSNDIRIRFRWISSEGFTYSWQVDDIQLIEASENDLKILSATHAAWDLSESDFKGLPYTIYPENEVRELKFRALVTNTGSQVQHNVYLEVAIDGPGSNDVTLTSNTIDLAPIATDSLFITGYTLPAVLGDYAVTYALIQDEAEDNPDDNTKQAVIAVSAYTFARDEGAMAGEYDNEGDEYELGNWFHTVDWDNTLYGIDVALSNRTDVGTLVRGDVYDSDRNLIMETEEYTVQSSDLNDIGEAKFITLQFDNPLPLDVDADYLITMHHYGGTEEVWCATSGVSIEQTSLILDNGTGTWFYVTNTPMVRMNLSPSVSVGEGASLIRGAYAQPSIFHDRTTLHFNNPQGGPVELTVHDAMGRQVKEATSIASAGQQELFVDGSALAPGPYTCILRSGSDQVAIRLVKE
ncbi:MAG: hypothetical protein WAU70_02185 [Flavobacteriales bacterium]